MKRITYSELLKLRSNRKLVKDTIYFTETSAYIARDEKTFRLYSNSLLVDIIISSTEPTNPKEGTLWIDTGDL